MYQLQLVSPSTSCSIVYYYWLFFEFFIPALTDGYLLKFKWERVSSSLQDSSKYSGRSQQCSTLDWLHSFSYFPVLQTFYQSFGDCTECTNYNWYHRHCHIPHFLLFPSKVEVLIFHFPSILLWGHLRQQSKQFCKFSCFFLIIIMSSRLAEIRWSVCVSKSQRSYYYYHYYSSEFFTPASDWLFPGVRMTASLSRSQGLFSLLLLLLLLHLSMFFVWSTMACRGRCFS